MSILTLPPSQALATSRLQRMSDLAKQAVRHLEASNINAAAIAVCKMEQHLPRVLEELAV